MPPDPCALNDVVHLSKLFDLRTHPDDRLELWPEPPLFCASVPDLGACSVQLVACDVCRLFDAAARVLRANGTVQVYWVLFERSDTNSYALLEKRDDWTLHNTDPFDVLKNLAVRLSSGSDGNHLRLSRDGKDFFTCAGPETLGQQLLCWLDWHGGGGQEIVFCGS